MVNVALTARSHTTNVAPDYATLTTHPRKALLIRPHGILRAMLQAATMTYGHASLKAMFQATLMDILHANLMVLAQATVKVLALIWLKAWADDILMATLVSGKVADAIQRRDQARMISKSI